ncbi:hypothetical protein XTPLMG730_3037 [Xanthomonas translucens pv. phlei]|uniref:Uncharacterized protein n=1 Tax=Xanthomonas graminis pv. phlei TaxID=487906 RepID=A0A0K2ZZI9_9XANT|nr:hypothetical protein XTPLMG730_3037 [Xanthomonas translucens pv. phlei]
MGARIPTHGVKLLTERSHRRSSAASAAHARAVRHGVGPSSAWPSGVRAAARRPRGARSQTAGRHLHRNPTALGIPAWATLSAVTETARPRRIATLPRCTPRPRRCAWAACLPLHPACPTARWTPCHGETAGAVLANGRRGVCCACLGARTHSPYRTRAAHRSRNHRLHAVYALYGANNEYPIVFPETILWHLTISIGSSTAAHFRLSSIQRHFIIINFIPDLDIHSHQIHALHVQSSFMVGRICWKTHLDTQGGRYARQTNPAENACPADRPTLTHHQSRQAYRTSPGSDIAPPLE